MTFEVTLFAGQCLTSAPMISQHFAMSASLVLNVSK